MSFSGGKRTSSIMYSSLVVLLIIPMLHIWAFKVRAIRILAEEAQTGKDQTQTDDQYIFRKFFNVTLSHLNNTLQENKRRVPSCPDPLHNK
nr:clavata3/endosperm 27 [Panax ginseng]